VSGMCPARGGGGRVPGTLTFFCSWFMTKKTVKSPCCSVETKCHHRWGTSHGTLRPTYETDSTEFSLSYRPHLHYATATKAATCHIGSIAVCITDIKYFRTLNGGNLSTDLEAMSLLSGHFLRKVHLLIFKKWNIFIFCRHD
jgi:hypothetical protein